MLFGFWPTCNNGVLPGTQPTQHSSSNSRQCISSIGIQLLSRGDTHSAAAGSTGWHHHHCDTILQPLAPDTGRHQGWQDVTPGAAGHGESLPGMMNKKAPQAGQRWGHHQQPAGWLIDSLIATLQPSGVSSWADMYCQYVRRRRMGWTYRGSACTVSTCAL